MDTPKNKLQSKTFWGIVAWVLGNIIQGFFPNAATTFLMDGFQWADIGPALDIIGLAWGAWGIRTAEEPIVKTKIFNRF
jgi:hypothetical protein